MIKAFEEKKEIARIMRNVFIVIAVVYVGLTIWSLCRQNYVHALFDVAILIMDIGYVCWCNASISDAELVLKYIEYVESRDELIYALSRNHPWISVKERLPEIDQTQHTKKKNLSVAVLAHDIDILHDALGQAYSPSVVRYDYERKDWLYVELGCYANEVEIGAEITHWMPIPELKKGE